jgi:hypothetical protein
MLWASSIDVDAPVPSLDPAGRSESRRNPAARPGASAAFSQSAAPPPQAAVFSKQLPMLSRSQRPLTPRAPTPLDAVIRTRLDQRSMDDQQQRDAERGRAQRRCRFEAREAVRPTRRSAVEATACGTDPATRPRVPAVRWSFVCATWIRRPERSGLADIQLHHSYERPLDSSSLSLGSSSLRSRRLNFGQLQSERYSAPSRRTPRLPPRPPGTPLSTRTFSSRFHRR